MTSQKEPTLDVLLKDLRAACEQQDWERLEALDALLKKKVESFVGMATTVEQKASLARLIVRIQSIYDTLRSQTETHRDELAEQFQKLSKEHKAVNSYLDSAGLS